MTDEEKYGLYLDELKSFKTVAAKLAGLAKDRGWDDNMPARGTLEDKRHRAMDIALMHSELSEALEGIRKDKADEHLPQYTSEEVELADTMIRILHYVDKHNLRTVEAMAAKHLYNMRRADHKRENRQAEGGKKF